VLLSVYDVVVIVFSSVC